jgi:hypothetical protein
MKVTIIQTTTKTLTLDRTVLATQVSETHLLEPDAGKMLRHKPTGQKFASKVCVSKERKIAEYEEIDREES